MKPAIEKSRWLRIEEEAATEAWKTPKISQIFVKMATDDVLQRVKSASSMQHTKCGKLTTSRTQWMPQKTVPLNCNIAKPDYPDYLR